MITFECEECESSFTVAAKLAGQAAKCKKCGHRFVIPSKSDGSAEIALAGRATPTTARERAKQASLARNSGGGTAVAARPVREPSLVGGRPVGWLDAVNSQVGLKPVTMLNARAILQRQKDEDDDGPSQYQMHIPSVPVANRVKGSAPVALAKKAMQQSRWTYQKIFIRLGGLLRWVDDAAYGFSILFLILAIVGVILSRHSYTIMGLSGIVLLSMLRIWTAVSNLVVKIFKKGPIDGLIFLIPPVAAYKIYNHWSKWEKPIKRVINPSLIICAVVVAYVYLPWINGKKRFSGSFMSQFEQGLEAVKRDAKASLSEVEGKVEKIGHNLPKKLQDMKLDEMAKKAGKSLSEASDKVGKSVEIGVSEVNKSLKKATDSEKEVSGKGDTKSPVKTKE